MAWMIQEHEIYMVVHFVASLVICPVEHRVVFSLKCL